MNSEYLKCECGLVFPREATEDHKMSSWHHSFLKSIQERKNPLIPFCPVKVTCDLPNPPTPPPLPMSPALEPIELPPSPRMSFSPVHHSDKTYCIACRKEVVNMYSHVKGQKHRYKSGESIPPPPPVFLQPTPHLPNRWWCDVCKVNLTKNSKFGHLKSNTHITKAKPKENQPVPSS